MGINSISSSNPYYHQKQQYANPTAINTNGQNVTLKAGTELNLQTINGKPYNMTIFEEGGYQWSGAIAVKATNSSVVTLADKMASYAADLYTRAEHTKASKITGVINYLYLITSRGWSADDFNDFTKQTGISESDVQEALGRLEVDINQSFTINERTFTFDSNGLKDYQGDE